MKWNIINNLIFFLLCSTLLHFFLGNDLFKFFVSDLAVGLINVSTDIAWRITVAWHAGNILCKIIRLLQTVVTYSSTYVLVALSIDRYDAITHPMNFSGSCEYFTIVYCIYMTIHHRTFNSYLQNR